MRLCVIHYGCSNLFLNLSGFRLYFLIITLYKVSFENA